MTFPALNVLLSLKAEILRKEEDLSKAKVENIEKIKSINKKSLELKNKGIDKRELNDISDEDPNLLRLSRSKLEAKSKLYDKLSKNTSSQSEETKRLFLVQFDKKEKDLILDADEPPDLPEESDEEENNASDYDDSNVNPDDEWVEYTDSLGRSRKCLRKDLNYFKSQDADLKGLAEERQQNIPQVENTLVEDTQIEVQPAEDTEKEMLSGDVRRELLRQQWEKEEMELLDRTDIHYQNVLFDEARQHGVGYYAFSKDEEERAKQQEALKTLRLETAREQKKSQDLKALREKQMAARMNAARNRKRVRLGLPPEEDEPEKSEVHEKSEEPSVPEEDESEKLLSEARKRHIRPWDIGKEGVKNEFYQMTQEEWNEKKRVERPKAFAPPSSYTKREFSSTKNIEDMVESSDKTLKFSSKANNESLKKRKLQNLNPYKNSEPSTSFNPIEELETPKFQSVPIVNEVGTGDFDDALLADYRKIMQNDVSEEVSESRDRGVEIPPPPTFDYFGPAEHKKVRKTGGINIEKSIEAGLKFLRHQTEGSNL